MYRNEERQMRDQETLERARRDRRQGKSPSTQAGEFVREEMHHIREGKHGAKSAKQAIAIGLSKARRAGVPLKPKKGKAAPKKRAATRRPSATRSRATRQALRREGRSAASHRALSRQAHSAARKRTKASRSASARKAARTRARVH
jgi:hypothetical protein